MKLLGHMLVFVRGHGGATAVNSRLLRVGATHSRLLVTLDVDMRMWMSMSMLEIVHLLAKFSVLFVHLTLLLLQIWKKKIFGWKFYYFCTNYACWRRSCSCCCLSNLCCSFMNWCCSWDCGRKLFGEWLNCVYIEGWTFVATLEGSTKPGFPETWPSWGFPPKGFLN